MKEFIKFFDAGLQEFVDSIPVSIFVKDVDSRIILMNRNCEEAWGIRSADIYGTKGEEFFPPDQMSAFLNEDQSLLASGEPRSVVEKYRNISTGQDRIGHTFKRLLHDEQGHPKYIVGITLDITERRIAESSLHTLDEKLRGLFALAPMGIALSTMDGKFVEFNRQFERLCGYSKEELCALDYWELTPPEYQPQEMIQLERLRTEGVYGPYEKEYIRKDGSRINLQLNGALIHDAAGTPYIWSIVEDISERKQVHERTKRLLREREALLQEVHHRVKNNLQVISSLLRMESARSGVQETSNVLNDMQGRIRSMALVHELLYRTGDFAQIGLDAYLSELCVMAFRMQDTHGGRVRLVLELEPVQVRMERATPCGLLVNELVSNALKHGFPEPVQGELRVRLHKTQDQRSFTLSVEDTGTGLPEAFSVATATGLGLMLANDLARQLGGVLEVQRIPHTRFSVTVIADELAKQAD